MFELYRQKNGVIGFIVLGEFDAWFELMLFPVVVGASWLFWSFLLVLNINILFAIFSISMKVSLLIKFSSKE